MPPPKMHAAKGVSHYASVLANEHAITFPERLHVAGVPWSRDRHEWSRDTAGAASTPNDT